MQNYGYFLGLETLPGGAPDATLPVCESWDETDAASRVLHVTSLSPQVHPTEAGARHARRESDGLQRDHTGCLQVSAARTHTHTHTHIHTYIHTTTRKYTGHLQGEFYTCTHTRANMHTHTHPYTERETLCSGRCFRARTHTYRNIQAAGM